MRGGVVQSSRTEYAALRDGIDGSGNMPMGSGQVRYLSLRKAAHRLGMAPSQLSRMRTAHPLYKPVVDGLPGLPCSRTTRFHHEQVRLIEAVLVGNTDLDTAWLEWRLVKGQIGKKPPEPKPKRQHAVKRRQRTRV